MKILITSILLCLLGASAGEAEKTAALEKLARALTQHDFDTLESAIKGLDPASDTRAAVSIVQAKLTDADPVVRRRAAYALSQLDAVAAKHAVGALLEALGDTESRVRARVAQALGKVGPAARTAGPALLELLRDPRGPVRASAARALAQVAEARLAVPGLVQLLHDPEVPVRGYAILALGECGPAAKEAVPALEALQEKDADLDVRNAAGQALEKIDPSPALLHAALASPDAGRRHWAVSLLRLKGPAARGSVLELIAVLQHDDSAQVRAAAAFALAKIGADPARISPPLVAALHDADAVVRHAAALALGTLASDAHGAAPALAATLQDENVEVASAAAVALGRQGAQAEAVVPRLVELLRSDDLALRRRAVAVLAALGPAAHGAVPALLESLKDSDPEVRDEAIRALISDGPQPGAPLPVLVEALHHNDAHVRSWACLSLGQAGSKAASAVPILLACLQDKDFHVASAAGLALTQVGPAAVPALAQALEHVDPRVRTGAARALGGGGFQARRAAPALRTALADESPDVRLAAAAALGRIAVALQLAQDPKALPDLEQSLSAVEQARGSQLEAEWAVPVEQVRVALQALRTVALAHFFEHMWDSVWFRWAVGVALYVVSLLSLCLLLLWRRPLVLLYVNDALRIFSRWRLPGPLSGVDVAPSYLLLVGFFQYHRRVLDAWVEKYAEVFRTQFEARRTVTERPVFVSVPVVCDGQTLAALGASHLQPIFARQRACLLIWGEGGAGKTTIACQLGRWALAVDPAHRLCTHRMLPVLVEHDLEPPLANEPAYMPLVKAVRGQLQALVPEAPPLAPEFLEQLLRRRRLLVIVDHLSEFAPAARAAIHPGHADFPAHALVVTSRVQETLDGVPRCNLQPLRVEGNRLSSFMEAYLLQRGKRQLFDDAEYFEACRRLALLAGKRDITVLLAKLFAEHMIGRKEAGPSHALPTNLPDLVLAYVNELNRAVCNTQRLHDYVVQRDAQVVAWECLRQHFRPESAAVDDVVRALGGTDARARLDYLEAQLKLIHVAEPARDRVSFTLDPLAEYLAALHLVSQNADNATLWRAFLDQVAALQNEHEMIAGFLRAVRECSLVRRTAAGVPDLLDAQLTRAA